MSMLHDSQQNRINIRRKFVLCLCGRSNGKKEQMLIIKIKVCLYVSNLS